MLHLVLALAFEPYDHLPGEPPAAALQAEPGVRHHGAHTLFVNFDGATLTAGAWGDNAMADETQFPDLGGEWPPFGEGVGGAQRQAILDAVRADLGRFAIDVVDERPASGVTYTMLVVSPRNGGGSQLGVASVHCGASNVAGIGFAFHSASSGEPAVKIASTIAHEASHTWGMEHVVDAADLMHAIYMSGDPALTDGCVPLDGEVYCGVVHESYCPPGSQDAVAELEAVFGSGSIEPDIEGPRVVIVAPGDAEVFAKDDAIAVKVDATDDGRISQVKLYRDGELVGTDIEAPYEWMLASMDEGEHDVYAVAIDGAGHESTSEAVAFHVGEAPPEQADDDDDAGDDDELPMGAEAPAGDAEGCSCRADAPASGGWLLLLLMFGRTPRKRPNRTRRAAISRSPTPFLDTSALPQHPSRPPTPLGR